ncbi:MAG: right-handed parallel beta-helix repeat-containing protein, partial [Kiritimatiellae bacterium]|nr:right-handed parallel beta-helix repeat-containing protein [Kiritimatiellia bacterium]
ADSGRVVYMADQPTDEVFELFTVPITGGTAMRINSALVAGGDVKFFMLTGNSYRALYIADQAADEVDEVYGGLVYPLLDIYVRGDGSGSDTTKGGTSWSDAYATLNKAFQSLTYLKELSPTTTPGPHRIYVQASTGAQKYDVAAARTTPYTSVPAYAMHVEFLGGWNNVDTTPVQNGWSVVHDADGTIDETPINWRNTAHYAWEWFDFTRFVFTNVLRGINLESDAGCDGGSVWCYMSNIFISARQEGIRLEHLHGYPVGGLTRLIATNITVTAGLGGPYHAVRIRGDFRGTRIGATTPANVSAITSAGGAGVYLWANYNTTYDAAIYDTVIYGCASNAVYMGAGASGTWYPVRGTFDNVTIADNGWAGGYDGIRMLSRTAGSWARVYDSIFADNAGHGVNVGESGYNVFVCYEGTNVFYNDTIMDEGTLQSFDPSTKTTDPMFAAEKTKPDPWYKLASPFSPAYKSDSRGRNRGAYQINAIKKGTTFMIR